MKVKDNMVPLSDCARVAEDRSLYDAVLMLEACRQRFEHSDYRPRVVLVYDKDFRIIGSLRQMDMLRALAPGKPVSDSDPSATTGSNWGEVWANLNKSARGIRVKDVMYRYSDSEYVAEDIPMEEAMTLLTEGRYLNLVVTANGASVGILRLSDIFSMACRDIKKSGMH
ncbi:MAG: HPP family protein [Syntrophobacteraceae bacterium]